MGTGAEQLRAVIFVPAGPEMMPKLNRCAAACDRQGWEAITVISNGIDRWGDALGLVTGGQADLIVVDSRDDLPPGRLPRVEVASEIPAAIMPPAQRSQRARRLPG